MAIRLAAAQATWPLYMVLLLGSLPGVSSDESGLKALPALRLGLQSRTSTGMGSGCAQEAAEDFQLSESRPLTADTCESSAAAAGAVCRLSGSGVPALRPACGPLCSGCQKAQSTTFSSTSYYHL